MAKGKQPAAATTYTHWLVKAEPESRIEKGVDVKFSIDDLERVKVSSWEGVRNHQANSYLRDQMKKDHLCLFYASNCKVPGVTGIAKVVKEGYPDHNAWDPKHPYYDPKSDPDKPRWYMVDVEFVSKLPHPVPLSLLQQLSTLSPSPSSSSTLPESLSYLSPTFLSSLSDSTLLRRGRLSVQPCEEGFFEGVREMGERGGWEDWEWKKAAGAKKGVKGKRAKKEVEEVEEEDVDGEKGGEEGEKEAMGRRSKRAKKA
ncbi:RHTO0S32e00430g1_1 [Rhodotorula toruloides]|uniref:RHTO0S32e00430g1_1 n=1 Tax=Rhodotorula toruloides TaxID=5286 RepID=A0A061BP30_RHOTO|nr:RHTO0S32e00430g1_1 [Rhodotorula toruloides]